MAVAKFFVILQPYSNIINYVFTMKMKAKLLIGLAFLSLGLTACKDGDGITYSEADKLKNAENALGVKIDPNQDWKMVTTVEANVTVNLGLDQQYSVYVYDENPLLNKDVVYYTRTTVAEGGTAHLTLSLPTAKTYYYVAVFDSKYRRVVKSFNITGTEGETVDVNFEPLKAATSRMATRGVTVNGDTYSEFNLPSEAELTAAFPTAIPQGATEVPADGDYHFYYNNGAGHNYQITAAGEYSIGGGWQNTEWVSDESYPNGGYTIVHPYNVYVKVNGNVTINRSGTPHFNLFILEGNVTLDSNFGEMGCQISVAEGATLIDNRNTLSCDFGTKVFNRGTFKTGGDYMIGNNAYFYNEGVFTVNNGNGALSYNAGSGNPPYFYNWGDDVVLSAGSFTLNSNGGFISEGIVNIAGETKVTQAGIGWINNGHYTTGSMVFSAHNSTFYNYCQLIVNDNCAFTDGSFNMMDNSYAQFGTGLFNNFHVEMGDNAGFNVTGGTKWGQQGAGIVQGFFAKNDNTQAYVRLAGDNYVPAHVGSAFHVSGANLTLAYENMTFWDNLNEISLWSTWSGTNYWGETSEEKLVGDQDGRTTWDLHNVTNIITGDDFSSTGFTLTDGQCAGTWNGGGGTPPGDPIVYTYAYEDTFMGDYDMNDVVLYVSENKDDNTQVDITLMCTGASFDLYVYYNLTPLFGGGEVHDVLSGGGARGKFINTGDISNDKFRVCEPVTTHMTKPSNFAIGNANFWILSPMGEIYVGRTYDGDTQHANAPYGIVIPEHRWKWPTEWTRITSAYSEFAGFAADRNTNKTWYNNITGDVYQ